MNGCCKAANQARGDDEVGLKAGRVDPIGQVLWPLPPPPLRTSRRHRCHQWVQTFSFFIIQWIPHFFFWHEFLFHILRCLLHLTRFVSSVSVFIVLLVQRQYDISRVRTVFRHHGRVGLCKHTHTIHCVHIVSSSWTAGLSAVLLQHTNPITPYPPPTAASQTDFCPFSFFFISLYFFPWCAGKSSCVGSAGSKIGICTADNL